MNLSLYLLVVSAGISLAWQQVVNANLRVELGSPWWAGLISYVGGAVVMLALIAASGEPVISSASVARTSWISWSGGIFGAIFIGISIIMTPRLGAALVVALVVVGQLLGSLAFDHFGLLGLRQHPAGPMRLAGATLLILGVVLIRS